MAKILQLTETCFSKLLTKPTKKKEKEKKVVVYRKITPLEALVDQEG